MTGLTLALNNALSGLNVNQQALSVLSQNIANANTPGYSRQVANLESVYLDGNGQGVTVADVTRKVDEYLASTIQRQSSTSAQTSTISDYQDRIQILIGNPGGQNNISAYTTTFFNSMQALAQTPDSSTLQQSVVNSANTLASGVSQLASALYDLQLQADRDIQSAVSNINANLANLYQLNSAIASATALGKSTADLQDRRDALITDLSQYVDIRTYTRESGAVNISTVGGFTLLSESLYKLEYSALSSATAFSSNSPTGQLTVVRLNDAGQVAGTPEVMVTSGTRDTVASTIADGKIKGLIEVRDRQIPALLQQLDTLAATLRDQTNAVHNLGSGYPAASSYTGTRLVSAGTSNLWEGSVRIAVLGADGQPVDAPYGTPAGAKLVPLTLDLSSLNSGNGEGLPTTQTIIDEINAYYGTPQNKAQLGNLNDIRMASLSNRLPGNPPQFEFDFDLSNFSSTDASFFVTNVVVKDDGNNNVAGVTLDVPSVALAATDTYVTTAGSNVVVVNTDDAHGFVNGQRVYLSVPPGDVDGIEAGNMGGFFIVSNVTSTSFEITVAQPAENGDSPDVASMTATPPYATVEAGQATRTGENGSIVADLTGSLTSQYYTVTATFSVDDGTGNISTGTATYRINSLSNNLLNKRISASAVSGDTTLVSPTSSQPIVTAMLVDANGNELPKSGGKYATNAEGYMVLRANGTGQTLVIDSLNSKETGPSSVIDGTNRGFSHYFELNNFFSSNAPTSTGDTVFGSALNMQMERRLLDNPNVISLGSLTAKADNPTLYERNAGDNSMVQRLSGLGTTAIGFSAAGGLGTSSQSFSSYAGTIISYTAQQANTANSNRVNSQTLLEGFQQRSSSISGVNLDTELANTIIYQNAYSASARIITVTNSLFDALLQAAGQ